MAPKYRFQQNCSLSNAVSTTKLASSFLVLMTLTRSTAICPRSSVMFVRTFVISARSCSSCLQVSSSCSKLKTNPYTSAQSHERMALKYRFQQNCSGGSAIVSPLHSKPQTPEL